MTVLFISYMHVGRRLLHRRNLLVEDGVDVGSGPERMRKADRPCCILVVFCLLMILITWFANNTNFAYDDYYAGSE